MEVLLFQFTQGYLGLGSTGQKWIEVKEGMPAFKTANPCVNISDSLSKYGQPLCSNVIPCCTLSLCKYTIYIMVMWKLWPVGQKKKRQYWEGIPGSTRKCAFKNGQVRAERNFLTVYFIQWNLAKYLKVGTIKHPSEYPFHSAVIGMKQSLSCHTVGNKPHAQEKQKEENILHLKKRGRGEKRRRGDCNSIIREQ